MHWRDRGVLLATRRHGESSAILEVFTELHGRHLGVLRGGSSRRVVPTLQLGAQMHVEWGGRLHEHIGNFRIEPIKSRAAPILSDRLALGALTSVCALLVRSLPEREPNSKFYAPTVELLDSIGHSGNWIAEYLSWELQLLEQIGIGLDLESCAATGATGDLAYISPKSGKAVSRRGAGRWANRLLPLPKCMLDKQFDGFKPIADGLRTTGYFLERGLISKRDQSPIPSARTRFVEAVERRSLAASR